MPENEAQVFQAVLGKVISHLRRSRGLSQAQFAADVGVSQSTLSRIEMGQSSPDAYQFRAVAEHLGTTPERLYEHVDRAVEKARALAAADRRVRQAGPKWWHIALATLGVLGVASLVALAVASVLGGSGDRDTS
jgi:transcriptional regulator with XRE-family HTH domain